MRFNLAIVYKISLADLGIPRPTPEPNFESVLSSGFSVLEQCFRCYCCFLSRRQSITPYTHDLAHDNLIYTLTLHHDRLRQIRCFYTSATRILPGDDSV